MQFDKKSLAVLSQRLWQAIAGLVTLFFIAKYLNPIEQGYYYTFASLAGLQSLLEMGLTTILVQQSAHEFSSLSWLAYGRIEGVSRYRYLGLVKNSLYWYFFASLIFLFAYPCGYLFFERQETEFGLIWKLPWLLLVVCSATSLAMQPVLSLVEGSGKVVEVYCVRLLQGMFGAIAVWCILLKGGGLYAVAMMPLFSTLLALIWMAIRYPILLIHALLGSVRTFDWWREIWPIQWRLGISWLCGYLLTQIQIPLLFKTQNPVVSGQMGVTLTFCNMIGLLSLAWMTSRVPAMAKAAGQRDWVFLDQEYKLGFKYSLAVFIFGGFAFVGLRYMADYTVYGARFLPFMETIGLVLATLFVHVSGLFGIYLRVHRREPFLWLSIGTALLTTAGSVWFAPIWSSAGVIIVLLVINVGISFPLSFLLWRKLRKKWHSSCY